MTENSKLISPGKISRFELLYHLSQTFNSTLNLNEVLDRVMDEVIAATRAERGFLMLHDDDGKLSFRTARGLDQTIIDDPEFQISRSVVETVAQKGDPVLTSDAQTDARFSDRRSVMELRLRSIICAPLILKEEVLGAIYVDNHLKAGIFTKDDLELLSAIASSAAIAIENAHLYQIAVEKGRMERELQMAYRVQSSLIPAQIPSFQGWEFAASWHPAREVSGDFYDFPMCGEDCIGLLIADVTDKGMPAALFMAMTRSIMRSSLDEAISPSDGITKANTLICNDSNIRMPVTAFYGIIDQRQDAFIYVNAGHNPPLLYRTSEIEPTALTRTGMLLGFLEEADYEQVTIQVNPGDFIVFYTDGITDAANATHESYGMDRFQAVIQEHKGLSAQDILSEIEKSVQDFIGSTAPYDDITLLIAKRL
jgi:sigma-B regulation protein RsbU (phosphoserine phosphatase)